MSSAEQQLLPTDERAREALSEAVAIMARLRGPDGCPWDREQTFDSIKRHTLEETYEVFDAIERRAWPDLKDELGDLLLQVLFYAQMAEDEGYFTIADVAENLNAKLIRRHPHIFGEAIATDSGAVLRNWEQMKREEKKEKLANGSILDDIPRSMPATLEASKIGSKAAKIGFDWPDSSGLFAKMDEELAELMVELESMSVGAVIDGEADSFAALRNDKQEKHRMERVEEEFGDLMFTAMNLARHLNVDAETALRRSNAKFRARFRHMEEQAGGAEALEKLNMSEMEESWIRAKAAEAKA